MAIEDNMYMPVAPTGGGMGSDSLWILILFFLLAGNGGFGGNGINGMYPWLNQSNQMADGFQNQALNTTLNGIQGSIVGGFSTAEVAACGRAQNDLERSFAAQTAVTQGLSGIQSQLAQCCCDNRLATTQTQGIIQSEAAATRLAIQNQTQTILDKMCAQEIDNLKALNVSLQNQLNMANLAASQTAQTAQIIAAIPKTTTTA